MIESLYSLISMNQPMINLVFWGGVIVLFAFLFTLKFRYISKISELKMLNGGYSFYENPKYAKRLCVLNIIRYTLVLSALLLLFLPSLLPDLVNAVVILLLLYIIVLAELIMEDIRLNLLLKGIK